MTETDPEQFLHLLACRSVASLIKQQQQQQQDTSKISLESDALDLLGQLLSLSMLNICATAKRWASTGKRCQLNAVDVHRTMRMRGSSPASLLTHLSACKALSQAKNVQIPSSHSVEHSARHSVENSARHSVENSTEHSAKYSTEHSANSPTPAVRCIKLETNYRPKHFYDFLPSLPSVHTYKRKSNKYISSTDKALIAYRKAEERRLMEKNLNHLWQQSGHSALWTTGRLNYDE